MTSAWTPTDLLLTRYLSDECADHEVQQVDRWLDESPANRQRLHEVRQLAGWTGPGEIASDQLWARVRAATVESNTSFHDAAPRPAAVTTRRTKWHGPTGLVAATVLLTVSALVATRWYTGRTSEAVVATNARPTIYRTARGQTATVQLSDGSRVTLAPNSQLSIAADFGAGRRHLDLEGEAVFDVHHDASAPFRVRTRYAVTEDIGTRFNLKANATDARVTVSVAEGAVALSMARDSTFQPIGKRAKAIVLRAGESGSISSRGDVSTAPGANVAAALDWTSGHLSFTKQPLGEVLQTIARWYDLDIRVSESTLSDHPVTADFATNDPTAMIRALALAVGADAERSGRVVTLTAR